MAYVKINDDLIHYNNAGRGKTIIFLHGLGGRSLTFFHQITHFKKSYRCIAPDFKGFGKSSPLRENKVTMNKVISDLNTFLKTLKVNKEKFILVGHSMGAIVGLDYAIRFPEKVEKLVLVGGCATFNHSLIARFGSPFLPLLAKVNIPIVKRLYALYLNVDYKYASQELRDWLVEEADLLDEQKTISLLKYGEMLTHWNVENKLRNVNTPTLIVRGENDLLMSYRASQFLYENIKTSSFVTIKNTGHCPTFESIKIFNKTLEQFLQNGKVSFKSSYLNIKQPNFYNPQINISPQQITQQLSI